MKIPRNKGTGIQDSDSRNFMSNDIIAAVLKNDKVKVSTILEIDPGAINTRAREHGFTPIQAAASLGNLSMVNLLLDAEGIDLAIKDRYGRNVFDMALSTGHQGIIDRLFRARARQLGLDGGVLPGGTPTSFKLN